jgi:hypothetical protein
MKNLKEKKVCVIYGIFTASNFFMLTIVVKSHILFGTEMEPKCTQKVCVIYGIFTASKGGDGNSLGQITHTFVFEKYV